MAIPSYNLIVITPQGVAYQGEVTHTRVPVEQGTIGVLADHAPLVTSSSGGVLEIRENNGGEKTFSVGNGFFEVNHNKATFLTQSFSNKV
jgi:F-type H+-transporting ATPase subunit epsilon